MKMQLGSLEKNLNFEPWCLCCCLKNVRITISVFSSSECEENDFRPPEAELDEYHPKATRTLFVGNLEKEISSQELKDKFKHYGEIIVSAEIVSILHLYF